MRPAPMKVIGRAYNAPLRDRQYGYFPILAHGCAARLPASQGASCATGGRMLMYHMLAYGFVGFTALLVMGLLVLWRLESRDVARRKKVVLAEIANPSRE